MKTPTQHRAKSRQLHPYFSFVLHLLISIVRGLSMRGAVFRATKRTEAKRTTNKSLKHCARRRRRREERRRNPNSATRARMRGKRTASRTREGASERGREGGGHVWDDEHRGGAALAVAVSTRSSPGSLTHTHTHRTHRFTSIHSHALLHTAQNHLRSFIIVILIVILIGHLLHTLASLA